MNINQDLKTATLRSPQDAEIARLSAELNGLVSMSRQLIATKLNIAGGKDPLVIQDAVDAADALIGFLVVPPVGSGFLETSETSALVEELDGFNNEDEAHCPLSVEERSWGRVKASYR